MGGKRTEAGVKLDTGKQGRLKAFLLHVGDKTLGRLFAYRERPKVIYPHREGGIAGTFTIGERCSVRPGVRIDCSGDVTVGDRCVISRGVKIMTHNHAYLSGVVDDITTSHPIHVRDLRIGDNVFIGEEAFILPGVGTIGDFAVIGVRAVLTRPVGPGEVWAGNPARMVGSRSGSD